MLVAISLAPAFSLNLLLMRNLVGPSVVRVVSTFDGEEELVGLVLLDCRGDLVGLAPTPGWNDFDVREGYGAMLGGA